MAYYNKAGLLILNEDQTEFLVCEKPPEFVTSDYIMPGGKIEEETPEATLKAEIKEELDCVLDSDSLGWIGEYVDVAAGRPDRDVSIKLWQGRVIGEPKPSTEIRALHWIGKAAVDNPRVSSIIRNKIIPDLVKRGILK